MSYKRQQEQKRRYKKLHNLTKHRYCIGVWEDKYGLIKPCYPYKKNGCNMSKYYRKCTNRKIRRLKYDKFDGSSYRKVYDLWWGLF